MLLCILVPLTAWLGRFPAPSNKWIRVKAAPVVVLICITCATYAVRIFADKRMYHFTLADCWLRPLKDQQYTWHNDQKSFPFVDLGKGVKLYLPDSTHDCLNASGPCMTWRYGLIEMRGNRVSDGFRNTRDEVIKYYPFVDE
jgi:hypothetical protein